jgi:hypothetical protein
VDDAVFTWAIGKALMIVMISFGALIYLAWAATWPKVSKNESDQKRRRQTRIRATSPRNAIGEALRPVLARLAPTIFE